PLLSEAALPYQPDELEEIWLLPVGERSIGPAQVRRLRILEGHLLKLFLIYFDAKPWSIGDNVEGPFHLDLLREQRTIIEAPVLFGWALTAFEPAEVGDGSTKMDGGGGADWS